MTRARSKRFMGVPDEFWIGFVIMVGFFLKLVYDIKLGYTQGTFQAGEWAAFRDGMPNSGHIGLIQYLFTYHRLPGVDPRLFPCYANPPFYYIVSSLILEIVHRIFGWEIGVALHMLQCVNVIYVLVGESFGIAILRKFGVRGRKLVICIVFLMFFPVYYNLAAVISPDALAFMLLMMILNSALSWYHSRRNNSLVNTAVLIGLGMMTSVYTLPVLPPVILLMYHAVIDGRRNMVPLRKQYKLFGIIAALMSLWWPVYKMIRFRLSPFYHDAPYGIRITEPFIERLRIPDSGMLWHLHTNGSGPLESNVWAQAFKTAVADFHAINISMTGTYIFAMLAVYLSVAICIISHLMLIHVLRKKRVERVYAQFIVVGYLSVLIGYLLLTWRIPYAGTMDFKKFAVILIFPLIGIGLCGEQEERSGSFERILSPVVTGMILLLSLITAFLFGYYV